MRKDFLLGLVGVVSVSPLFLSACANATVANKGFIAGSVLIGPTCPVERIPPDPACAPKGYSSTIKVFSLKTGKLQNILQTSATGKFNLTIPSGTYILRAVGGTIYPRCTDKTVKVLTGKKLRVVLNCDSGIR